MKKLEDVFKANDPFANEENELINMNTKAVMPVTVKEAVLKCDKIGQDFFNNSDGHLSHCVGKSKLEGSLPDQSPDQEEEQRQHAGRSVVIIDDMAVVQLMGKPTRVHNGRDLAGHFLEIIDSSFKRGPRGGSALFGD